MSNHLMKYLPGYYKISKVMTNITDAENAELQLFKNNLTKTLNQFFIDLADTSLEKWEKELSIPINNNKPDEFRRERIKAKIRGTGTVTKQMIKEVASSYSNGEVEVIEDNENYRFIIKFVGTIGIPANMADLIVTIEEIKPAHLTYTFEYTYRTYGELTAYTHETLSVSTHQNLREGVI